MNKIRKFLKYWFPPLAWAVVIFLFSSRAVPVTSEFYWNDFILKKTAHIIEYAILVILLYRAFTGGGKTKKQAMVFSFLLTLVYAISDEIHQSFVPGRESRIRDVIFDTIGGGGALYLIKVYS